MENKTFFFLLYKSRVRYSNPISHTNEKKIVQSTRMPIPNRNKERSFESWMTHSRSVSLSFSWLLVLLSLLFSITVWILFHLTRNTASQLQTTYSKNWFGIVHVHRKESNMEKKSNFFTLFKRPVWLYVLTLSQDTDQNDTNSSSFFQFVIYWILARSLCVFLGYFSKTLLSERVYTVYFNVISSVCVMVSWCFFLFLSSFSMLMNALVLIELAALWTIQANYVDDFDVVAWLEHHLKWLNSTIIESQTTPASSSTTTTTFAAMEESNRENVILFFFPLLPSHGHGVFHGFAFFSFCIHFTSSLSFVRLWLYSV